MNCDQQIMAEAITGRVRANARPQNSQGVDSAFGALPGGEQLFANALPTKTESVRLGDCWTVQIATGSAFTPVAANPTTRAELALYNGESGGGKSYIIDSIWYYSITSQAALACCTIVYQVAQVAALTNDTAQLINSPLGKVYGGRALRAVAVTTMTANKWVAVAASASAATATIGFGCVANVDGGIIVTPGMTLGVNAVVGTGAGSALMGFSWREEILSPY
jgi:hypothetical protein